MGGTLASKIRMDPRSAIGLIGLHRNSDGEARPTVYCGPERKGTRGSPRLFVTFARVGLFCHA